MSNNVRHCCIRTLICFFLACAPRAYAQQTLGGITGTVTDSSGAVVPAATVTIVGDQTKLTRTLQTTDTGRYDFVNLPIGNYTITFNRTGFQSLNIPSIQVQANRTATVDAALKVGQVGESITVEETPLLNVVDTTNGYVMDQAELEAVPLPTGSFTGYVMLSPGVDEELPAGTGANAGLGNQPVWANGQRDTSNTFLLNGVDAKNIFNGKTTSQVTSSRVVNETGVSTSSALSALPVQSSASVYLAVGESIPTPAPESIQEVRVNTSMYDAQQGSTSGAHIDMSTGSGTNNIHGQAYVHRGTNWLNADPYFFNADPNIPQDEKNPGLHRYSAGGTVGLPIVKNKLFFYGSYQHTHASDDEIGISRPTVPPGLTDDRSAAALAAVGNSNNLSGPNSLGLNDTLINPMGTIGTAPGDINPIAYTLFNYKFPNGQYLIPSANPNAIALTTSNPALIEAFPEDAEIPGTAYFIADQAVSDLDWNPNSTHSFSLKYYYQHDPTTAPYAYSSVAGFAQHLDAGSQVISLSHTQIVRSNLSITETFGFIREKAYSTVSQPFTPAQFAGACEAATSAAGASVSATDCTINTFGSSIFPGITITWPGTVLPSYQPVLNVGAGALSLAAFTGVFQNRFNPSASAIWTLGKHTITFGGSFAYTQLNTRDRRNDLGTIESQSINQFLQGELEDDYLYAGTIVLNGNPNRYWRANETGEYIQDKYQMRSNLSITAGVRFDWDGGLTEKNGNLINFDPSKYSYDPTMEPTLANPNSNPILSTGIIVAGNSPHATSGVSNSTLTGRQWGFAPRIGVAWSPKMFSSKVVVRAGWGMYYDRGELYSYLSLPGAQSLAPGGPFGINQQQPFVGGQFCPTAVPGTFEPCSTTLSSPWGPSLQPAPSGNPSTVAQINPVTGVAAMPNAAGLQNGDTPFYFAAYARNNKLPYTMNSSLDIQWQPRNDLAIDIGAVDALGRHEVIPVPFNQARIATPTNPLCGPAPVCPNPSASPYAQSYTYGYTVQTGTLADGCGFLTCTLNLPNGQPMQFNIDGGNTDERVPYIGYSADSEEYTAAGVSAYNALQVHVEKRISHGLQAGFSYTFSRSFDEQSALGLYYNGNNPQDLHGGYGPSDYDRTHVFNIDYHYELPKFAPASTVEGKFVDGWSVQGLVTLQSGQPYSVIDYSGAVGSAFYSITDGITNPIAPLAPGCTAKNAVTGAIGNNFNFPALKASCFTVPLLYPCSAPNAQALDGSFPCSAIPPGDTFETNFLAGGGQRNIFRQSWQKRGDISVVKATQITERFTLKYSLDIFNLTNHPSFDIPIDNIDQNLAFSPFPVAQAPYGTGTTPTLATGCGTSNAANGFYYCPTGLGQTVKTIGSSRQIQMSLSLLF